MKILMTGFSGLQCGNKSSRSMSRMSVPEIIKKKLEELDKTILVDWRETVPGERLDKRYDLIWVNLAGCLSFNAPCTLGAFWAMSFKKIPTILFWDDWKINQTLQHARSFAAWKERQIFKKISGSYLYRFVDFVDKKVLLSIVSTAGNFANMDWSDLEWSDLGYQRVNTYPAFTWGDEEVVEKMIPKGCPLIPFDPSSQVKLIKYKPLKKEKRWGLGTIVNKEYQKWISKLSSVSDSWTIDIFGSTGLIKIYGGSKLKTEIDLQNEYAKRWGILSPPYTYLSSGWFRTRYLYSANCKSIIYSEPGDVPLSGHNLNKGFIEKFNELELESLANTQAHETLSYLTTNDFLKNQILKIVNTVVRG
jgi:hypothetical protein